MIRSIRIILIFKINKKIMERLLKSKGNKKLGIIFEEKEEYYHILGYSNNLLTYSKKILKNLELKMSY